MNHKNLEQLDFFRVREIVSSFAMTQEGKETVLSILPYTDKKQISNAKELQTQSLVNKHLEELKNLEIIVKKKEIYHFL